MFNRPRDYKPNLREMMNYQEDKLEEAFRNLLKFIPSLNDEDPLTYAIFLNLKKDLTDDERQAVINIMNQKAAEEHENNLLMLQKFNLDNNND